VVEWNKSAVTSGKESLRFVSKALVLLGDGAWRVLGTRVVAFGLRKLSAS
jgi:hypothetical protein